MISRTVKYSGVKESKYCILPVESISISFIIYWNKVHHQHIICQRIHSIYSNLIGWKHSPEKDKSFKHKPLLVLYCSFRFYIQFNGFSQVVDRSKTRSCKDYQNVSALTTKNECNNK